MLGHLGGRIQTRIRTRCIRTDGEVAGGGRLRGLQYHSRRIGSRSPDEREEREKKRKEIGESVLGLGRGLGGRIQG